MEEGTIGEIRLFAGTFAPQDWAFCDGSVLQIRDNMALFSLLGTQFGGDGQTMYVIGGNDTMDTIHRVTDYAAGQGYEMRGKHHEIYLSDPRRVAPEKLKTVLRRPVRKG